MDVNKILNADILDIIFDGRNKEYGAYDLRKTYNKRLLRALIGTAVVILLLFGSFFVSNLDLAKKKTAMVVQDVQLEQVEQKKDEPPPPPPPKVEPPKVEMAKFTPPKIVPDDKVKEDEKPPEQEKLEDTKIGTVNQEGIKDEGITAPPSDAGKGVVAAPVDNTDYDKTFTKVEIESEYPGGSAAWLRYLNKNFRYPDEAVNNDIQGTVVVQFIVDKEGNVSDVQAISGPTDGGLRDEAIRVIKKSGKWTPAIQNGRQVKSYKKQPIVFKLEAQ
ncbi:MAG: TonB family protein [Bacteroidota bacterium]|nr:TonB family protein [Bacteroidota bacterium]MDP4216197.1 TonB family protein [Bacteroidota bacterium]MDP4244398.1 TonB family protein [Bacteroidota bacterium]MDP4256127.1 TonB family protein [Bacteroidota bacterium]MDP4259414.1 TonB family protein [Bacteroidota bacterium]